MSKVFLCGRYSASLEAITQPTHVSLSRRVRQGSEGHTRSATADDDIVKAVAVGSWQLCRGPSGRHRE